MDGEEDADDGPDGVQRVHGTDAAFSVTLSNHPVRNEGEGHARATVAGSMIAGERCWTSEEGVSGVGPLQAPHDPAHHQALP
jgi:hypothetical protein